MGPLRFAASITLEARPDQALGESCGRTFRFNREGAPWESASSPSVDALSCREAGCVLVTGNQRDFQRIRGYVQFDFVTPWPAGLAP
jgi:hypothetical protein